MIGSHFDEVCQTSDFQELSESMLGEIIKRSDLNIPNENSVFLALKHWAEYNRDEREEAFFRLLENVRLPYCTSALLEHVISKDVWMSQREAQSYIEEARSYHLNPGKQHFKSNIRFQPREKFDIKQVMVALALSGPDGKLKLTYWDSRFWRDYTDITDECESSYYEICCTHTSIVLTGGTDNSRRNFVGECWSFDLLEQRWKKLSSLKKPRVGHAMVSDGREIHVLGGFSATLRGIQVELSMETYSPVLGVWKEGIPLPETFVYPAAVFLGRHIYVISKGMEQTKWCSKKIFAYDTISHMWEGKADMPSLCKSGSITALDDKLYVVCGEPPLCMVYDTCADSWITCDPPSSPVSRPLAITWQGKVLFVDGKQEAQFEEFQAEKWTDSKLRLITGCKNIFVMDIPKYVLERQ